MNLLWWLALLCLVVGALLSWLCRPRGNGYDCMGGFVLWAIGLILLVWSFSLAIAAAQLGATPWTG